MRPLDGRQDHHGTLVLVLVLVLLLLLVLVLLDVAKDVAGLLLAAFGGRGTLDSEPTRRGWREREGEREGVRTKYEENEVRSSITHTRP